MGKHILIYSTGRELYYRSGMMSYLEISQTTAKIVLYLEDLGATNQTCTNKVDYAHTFCYHSKLYDSQEELGMAGQKRNISRQHHYEKMTPYLQWCVFPNINWHRVWTHHDSRWEVVKVAFTILQLSEYYPFFMTPYIPGFICREVKRWKPWLNHMHQCYHCRVISDICSEYNIKNPCNYMTSSEDGETILITRRNITYQIIDKELTGKVHWIRAREFTKQAQATNYITPVYLETATPAAKEYIARLAYVRLVTDYDWELA